MNYIQLTRSTEEFVKMTFASSDRQFPYHNLVHTVRVVEDAMEIAQYYLLKEEQQFIITVAAWFHDIGHLFGEIEGHEERGVLIMESYTSPFSLPEKMVLTIANCIMATRYPSHPATLYEEILCDADTFHFGTGYFQKTDAAVKMEMEMRTGKVITDWHQKSIKLLEEHRYFTKYCRQLLNPGKLDNIRWLRSLRD
ncbi:MAG TPA: HD domain-containing protein [Puia sp.]|nr:HD domain-containing protein [Puia sp.]